MMSFMIVGTPKICSIFDMKWHKEHLQTSLKNITHLTYSTNITPLFQSLQNYFNSSSLHDCKRRLKAEKNREKFWEIKNNEIAWKMSENSRTKWMLFTLFID